MRTLLAILLLCQISFAAETSKPAKVNYQYKKYEHFDLGDLEVQGNLIAPGDLSVKDQGAHLMDRNLYIRNNFDKEMRTDVLDLR
ncbi:MAG: hypothetical protein A2X86_02380 [Bdellovibrionales bacterium GWA2_49_15]|nr:MAG: hypothetical protein A2X86_02380 [Bdellovibrionales bacterium GWA2_49_15]